MFFIACENFVYCYSDNKRYSKIQKVQNRKRTSYYKTLYKKRLSNTIADE